jgi:XTP/dITP diphosphohydrolase
MDTNVSRDLNVKNRPRQNKKKDRKRKVVLLAATGNHHKVREIAQILGRRFQVFGLHTLFKAPWIVESGRTFDANASIKARYIHDVLLRMKDLPLPIDFVIADDSGLQVKALRWAPGIRSARYAGPRADDAANRSKLLHEMENKSDRSAKFHCSVAIIPTNGKKIQIFRGCIAGRITRVERGKGGFGYDPLFVPVGRSATFSELSAVTKNKISHRARALRRMKRWIEKSSRV